MLRQLAPVFLIGQRSRQRGAEIIAACELIATAESAIEFRDAA
jgi:hypothetical protein